jgi:hypothetical protein
MRVVADQLLLEEAAHCLGEDPAAAAPDIAEADPLDAVVALDLDEAVVALAHRAVREGGRDVERDRDGGGADARDLRHGGSSRVQRRRR